MPILHRLCDECAGAGEVFEGDEQTGEGEFELCLTCEGEGSVPEGPVAKPEHDPVTKPAHYDFPIQPIDFIEACQLGFHEANVVKYVSRAKHKGNELQDLKKAEFYLQRLIARLEAEGKR